MPNSAAPKSNGEQEQQQAAPARKSKADLWNGCLEKKIGDGAIVQMDGIGSESHTVYARMLPCPVKNDGGEAVQKLTIGTVVDVLVGEGWRQAAKEILENHTHIEKDTFPSAKQLLELGAVWLLNETEYTKGGSAHAHRCKVSEEDRIPNWEDFSLRVHYAPERFFSCYEVDWGKYCRGLLIGGTVEAAIAGEIPHVPLQGLPDRKDGVIVYENPDLGYAIINKPGPLPFYATIQNQLEDVFTMFTNAQTDRRNNDPNHPHQHCKKYASIPLRSGIDTEMSGLLPIATKKEFCVYMKKLMEHTKQQHHPPATDDPYFIKKVYRCLVCIKNSETLDQLEKFQKAKTIITHYTSCKSPPPKRFYRNKPTSMNDNHHHNNRHHHHQNNNKNQQDNYIQCLMRINKVGCCNENENGKKNNTSDKVHQKILRAACVSSKYIDNDSASMDSHLAHALWGISLEHPAEDIHTQYVMELQVEVFGIHHAHQIRGQLAALGCPIVGDVRYGGGKCEYRSHMHGWKRMAIQCSELSFMEPKLGPPEEGQQQQQPKQQQPKQQQPKQKQAEPTTAATTNGGAETPAATAAATAIAPTNSEDSKTEPKQVYVPSNRRCYFRLNKAWWSEYLEKYDAHYSKIQ